MPIGEILTKSFHYVSKNRALWFYGILLAIFSGTSNYQVNRTDLQSFSNLNPAALAGVVAATAVFALIFGIIALVVNSWATASLIKGTDQLEKGKKVTRKEIGKTGKSVVWRLIVLNFFIPLLLVLVLIALVGLGVLLVLLLPKSVQMGIGITLLVLFLLALIPFAVYISQVWLLAVPLLVLEDKKPWESLKAALALVKGKFWWTFLFSIILGLISGVIVFALFVPMFIAFGGLVWAIMAKNWGLVGLGGIFSLAVLVAFVAITGIVQAFISVAKTLYFFNLREVKKTA